MHKPISNQHDIIREMAFKSEEECELFRSILQKELESKELWNETHCIDLLVENARDVGKGKTVDNPIIKRKLKLRWNQTKLTLRTRDIAKGSSSAK